MVRQYEFYPKPDYYRQLAHKISKTVAGDRIALATMGFEPSVSEVRDIMEHLISAASRGVKVFLAVDAHSFLVARDKLAPGPLFFYGHLHGRMSRLFRGKIEILEKLKEAGGHYGITNVPSRPLTRPFAGRSHLKIAVINDQFYLGGCNLDDVNHIDLMVGWEDKGASDWLYELLVRIIKAGSVRQAVGDKDLIYALPNGPKLIFDCGVPRQSTVYKEALGLIDDAQRSIFIACQYHLNGTTLKHLAAASRRGIKVEIVCNNAFKRGVIKGSAHQSVVLRERARTPATLFQGQLPISQPFLHAKLIATDQGAIIGSHNYVKAGVNFGTAEIALLYHDPIFGKQAKEALKKQYEPTFKDVSLLSEGRTLGGS